MAASRDIPLELLRAFEAAARLLSFTRAADELFLTQSAISRQIKALETHLGTALFERRHRAIVLTDAGQTLYRTTVEVLEQLRRTVGQLQRRRTRRAVTVTTTISFASLWLVPRLPDFVRAHPGVDLRISATNRVIDVDREDVEFALRYLPIDRAQGPALFGEQVSPVCAPSLLRDRRRPLRRPADLAGHTLLCFASADGAVPALDWTLWLESVGLRDLEPAAMLQFSQYDHLIQAAIDGQGVALGRSPLVRDALRAQRLVRPFPTSLVSPRAYYLIESRRAREDADARAFREWLLAACEAVRVADGDALIR